MPAPQFKPTREDYSDILAIRPEYHGPGLNYLYFGPNEIRLDHEFLQVLVLEKMVLLLFGNGKVTPKAKTKVVLLLPRVDLPTPPDNVLAFDFNGNELWQIEHLWKAKYVDISYLESTGLVAADNEGNHYLIDERTGKKSKIE